MTRSSTITERIICLVNFFGRSFTQKNFFKITAANLGTPNRICCFRILVLQVVRHCGVAKYHSNNTSFLDPSFGETSRGVSRLDGARGKKQVWRPHVRIWGLHEVNVLYWRKYCDIVGTFSGTPQSFGAPIALRRPGNCSPLPPLVTPLEPRT